MALKLEQNKTNKDENNSAEKCVKEEKQAQEQSVKKKSKIGKRNKTKAKTVCLPSGSNTVYYRSSSLPLLPTPIVSTMATYYPQTYSQPIAVDWNPMVATLLPNPVYTLPFQSLPVVVSPVVTPLCPYSCAVLAPQIIAPVVQPIVTEIPAVNYTYEQETSVTYVDSVIEPTQVNEQYYGQDEHATSYVEQIIDSPAQAYDISYYSIPEDSKVAYDEAKDFSSDPIEIYLSLPKDLFPTSRMLTIDPNPIIDEFCKLKNVHNHAPWILDLEFGVPKSPVTRQIPIYNVNYNSIHCKNTPDAVHPGFDSCNEEFKRVLLFYYDCMISSLYRGYVLLNCDTSVQNFQAWLLLPMQVFGMCWP